MRKVLVPMVSCAALLLSGCAVKCDYAKFHEKAVAACEKEMPFATCEVKYSYESDGNKGNGTAKLKFGADVAGVLTVKMWVVDGDSNGYAATAAQIANTKADSVPEYDDATYYTVGNGLKAEREELVVSFNQYGLITSYKTPTQTYTLNYKK